MSKAIGEATMNRILGVTDELRACVEDCFESYQGVYRLNDMGEYVSEGDWERVWAGRPSWWPKAWMLADNGQFSAEQVGRLSVEQIEALFDSPAFEPEYAYYTDAGEDGMM